jgi:mRNA-degrading endonuclease RelE of RelBE toxin-antitoxin system
VTDERKVGKASTPRRRGASAPKARKGAGASPALPGPDGDAALQELTRDELSVFLYAALLPEETLQLVRELGLSVPGFRVEGLSEAERCDLVADELRAAPEVRGRVLELLRKGYGHPPLLGTGLDEAAARDLLDVGTTEHGMVLALWRLLADPAGPVRALAKPMLARLVEEYYGPAPGAAEGQPHADGEEGAPGDAGAERRLAALEGELKRARAQADRVREKGEERAEKLQSQLKEARGAEARAVDEAARSREAAEQARRALQRAEEALAALRATDASAEAQRARQENRELAGRLAAAEARGERAQARIEEQERALEEARRKVEAAGAVAAPTTGPEEPAEPDEAPGSWLRPIYTREFYDSLEGWDRRIQRAAFKQAHLLAQDHRHPSLRALPLEGLPGYYRVRVATDVRLIYRRGEDQGAVEILSLIDREDLDRYVRQAKTRG